MVVSACYPVTQEHEAEELLWGPGYVVSSRNVDCIQISPWDLGWFFFFFHTESCCVALAGPELTLKTRLGSNSQRRTCPECWGWRCAPGAVPLWNLAFRCVYRTGIAGSSGNSVLILGGTSMLILFNSRWIILFNNSYPDGHEVYVYLFILGDGAFYCSPRMPSDSLCQDILELFLVILLLQPSGCWDYSYQNEL